MKLMTQTIRISAALVALCAGFTLTAAEAPKLNEVYDVIRANLNEVNPTELNELAVQGLLGKFPGRIVLVTNQTETVTATGSGAYLSQTNIFDESFAYLRVGNVGAGLPDQLAASYARMAGEKKIKGLVLDLRYAKGQDYAAAVKTLDQFVTTEKPQLALGGVPLRTTNKDKSISVPITILVNRQTSGAAEALAALLRQNHAGLILGTNTAGEAHLFKDFPLTTGQTLRIANGVIRLGDGEAMSAKGVKPDIHVDVMAEDERRYFADPFKESGKAAVTVTNTVAGASTNAPRRRLNEAELVRRQREGQNPNEEVATGKLRDLEPPKPVVQDPALARALDLLKGLAVVKQFRNP